MTDTIRPKIDAIVPGLSGTPPRTLSDIYDVLQVGLDRTADAANWSELLSFLASIDGKLDALADISAGIGDINVSLAPLADINTEIALISDQIENVNVSIGDGNSLLGDVNTSVGGLSSTIGDIETAILSGNTLSVDGNSLLGDISIAIGSNNTLTADITTAIEANTTMTLDTSVSIRGEIVALTLQDSSNHGEAMAQLITIADQVGLARAAAELTVAGLDQLDGNVQQIAPYLADAIAAQTAAFEASINTQSAAFEATIAVQTAAIEALFADYIGQSYDGSDPEPVRVAAWLARMDDKLRVIAAEYGWGT